MSEPAGVSGAPIPRSDDDFASVFVGSVRLVNFRGIDSCEVTLEPDLTVLVGCNNVGKSRILRALAIALGATVADRDDLTVAGPGEAVIDVILAPSPTADGADEVFNERVARRLNGVQYISETPVRERFGWRTRIRKSQEGLGVRSDHTLLLFDDRTQSWEEQEGTSALYEQRSVVEADLVETRRDLVEEFARRGSPIRRVLDELEVAGDERSELEAELSALGDKIVNVSGSLEAVLLAMEALRDSVDGLGTPSLRPLPMRLEDLARSVSIDLDAGTGSLPLRFHGAGARSLASLQVQSVLYDRRLGRDGVALRPHPVSLIEEPEAHLHPQAQFELAGLLDRIRGQVIVSTHSSHLASVAEPRMLRLLRHGDGQTDAIDLRPAETDADAAHRARRPSLHIEEMEKLRRMVERPFGELLFSSAVIIGDGATERSLIPPLARHWLGSRAHGLCVVDPGSMASEYASAVVKFAGLVGLPWFLLADSDGAGKAAARQLVAGHGGCEETQIVWVPGLPEDGNDSASEQMLLDHDRDMCVAACRQVGYHDGQELLAFMTKKKGVLGRLVALELIRRYPWHPQLGEPRERAGDEAGATGEETKRESELPNWPRPLIDLMTRLDTVLPGGDRADG